MDTQTLICVFLVFFISSFLKGLTGLGFSTICIGLLAIFLDIKIAIPLIFLPSITSNIIVMIQAGRFSEAIRRFWVLILSCLPGILLGAWLLTKSSGKIPTIALGLVMIIYSLLDLQKRTSSISSEKEKHLNPLIGLLSGGINGMTGSQIIPVLPYLLSLKLNRDLFVQTLNCVFSFNTVVLMIFLGKTGYIHQKTLLFSLTGIIPVALGVLVGGSIRKKIPEKIFRQIIMLFLLLLGLILIGKALFLS